MVRLVNVVIPKDNYQVVNDVIRALSQALYVFQVTNYSSKDFEHFNFKTKDKHLQYVLTQLQSYGCGVNYGIVDVLTLVLSKPPIQFKLQPYYTDESLYHRTHSEYGEYMDHQDVEKQPTESPSASPQLSARQPFNVQHGPSRNNGIPSIDPAESSDDEGRSAKLNGNAGAPSRVTLSADKHGNDPSKVGKKKYRISERMTIDEISIKIDEGNHLTFNYMALLACASVIAGAGLISDSATTIIASMLGKFIEKTVVAK